MSKRSQYFAAHGVDIQLPETVFIGPEVPDDAIAPGVIIYPGCRLSGENLSIGPDCEIGRESPATLEDCQLAGRVRFKGGFAQGAVMLHGASMGSGCHLRPGTLLEEQAGGAHAVGLKQTILMPFVTLGSLVNFCDVLMAGGTGPRDHSEVGSSYIHFNFTPHGDKATPSLIGDVPRGVMLNQHPIFLGGQGGLVGPARIAYGTVIAAGSVYRHDVEEEDQLVMPASPAHPIQRPYDVRVYRDLETRIAKNLVYLGNLLALREWYRVIRARLITGNRYDQACQEGALQALELIIAERLRWLEKLSDKVAVSNEILNQETSGVSNPLQQAHQNYLEAAPGLVARLKQDTLGTMAHAARDRLLDALPHEPHPARYTEIIQSLPEEARASGTTWLQAITNEVAGRWPVNP